MACERTHNPDEFEFEFAVASRSGVTAREPMCAGFTTAIAGAAIGQAGGPLDGLGHGAALDSEHAHNFPAPRDVVGHASESHARAWT